MNDKVLVHTIAKNTAQLLSNVLGLGEYERTDCDTMFTDNTKFYTCRVKFEKGTISFDMTTIPEKGLIVTRSRVSPIIMYSNVKTDVDIIEKNLLNKIIELDNNKKKVVDSIFCKYANDKMWICILDLKNYKSRNNNNKINIKELLSNINIENIKQKIMTRK